MRTVIEAHRALTRSQSRLATDAEQALTRDIIAAAIEVHRSLGPGLLESAYQICLCRELQLRGVPFQQQVELPVAYKGVNLDCGYRIDLIVEREGRRRVEGDQRYSAGSRSAVTDIPKADGIAGRSADQLQRCCAKEWHPQKSSVILILCASVSLW